MCGKFVRRGIVVYGLLCWFAPLAVQSAGFGPNDEPFVSAQWIAPPSDYDPQAALPLFRKEFHLDGATRRATLRIIGLGDYDARFNGRRLASTGINQPWSQYERTVYYRDYDITSMLQPGANCLGVMLTNSFWHNQRPPAGRYYKNGPQRAASEPLLLLAEIYLETDDGNVRQIGTDTSWRTHPGPIVFSHIFAGEDYDARRQQAGWDLPGFDTSQWKAARVVPATSAARAHSIGRRSRHIRVLRRHPSVSRNVESGCTRFLKTVLLRCGSRCLVVMQAIESGSNVENTKARHNGCSGITSLIVS